MDDPTVVILTLTSAVISAVPGVAALILRWRDRRKLKPDIRVKPVWGYYQQDVLASGRKGNTRLYLEVYVENHGQKGTTVKSVIARVPSGGGVVMEEEGHPVEKSERVPVHLNGDYVSVLFKMNFDFLDAPQLKQNFTTPSIMNHIPPISGLSLDAEVIVVDTYSRRSAKYPAYPEGSWEAILQRSLATASSTRD
jgi:hypothetical protein